MRNLFWFKITFYFTRLLMDSFNLLLKITTVLQFLVLFLVALVIYYICSSSCVHQQALHKNSNKSYTVVVTATNWVLSFLLSRWEEYLLLPQILKHQRWLIPIHFSKGRPHRDAEILQLFLKTCVLWMLKLGKYQDYQTICARVFSEYISEELLVQAEV